MLRCAVAASYAALLHLSVALSASAVAAQATAGTSTAASSGTTDISDSRAENTSLERRVLGYGRLTTNDLIGDGHDRWRTGSVTMSRIWGYEWTGALPVQFGDVLETRIQGQIIAPANLETANAADRPHAGTLTIGIHTHFSPGTIEYALGVDLAAIGPQTRLDSLQSALHGLIGQPEPSAGVLALQIDNQFRPTLVAELGRNFRVNELVDLRPFAELRAGDETMARVGADVTFGSVTNGELLSRESVTGQRYRVIYRSAPGVSFVFGGDVARVSDSIYLPEDRGFQLTDRRNRLRAGMHWQGENTSVFYGVAYLGREFKAQPEGQVVGSIRLKLSF